MLGYKLPQAYVELMKMHNGGLGNQFMIDEWKYPAIGVVICDTPSAGHDMVFLVIENVVLLENLVLYMWIKSTIIRLQNLQMILRSLLVNYV